MDLVNSTVLLFILHIIVPTFKEQINLFTAMITVMNTNESLV